MEKIKQRFRIVPWAVVGELSRALEYLLGFACTAVLRAALPSPFEPIGTVARIVVALVWATNIFTFIMMAWHVARTAYRRGIWAVLASFGTAINWSLFDIPWIAAGLPFGVGCAALVLELACFTLLMIAVFTLLICLITGQWRTLSYVRRTEPSDPREDEWRENWPVLRVRLLTDPASIDADAVEWMRLRSLMLADPRNGEEADRLIDCFEHGVPTHGQTLRLADLMKASEHPY